MSTESFGITQRNETMKKIITITIATMTALSFIMLTSCEKENNSTGKDLQKALQKEGSALDKTSEKALDKVQDAYDDANKQLENALKQ